MGVKQVIFDTLKSAGPSTANKLKEALGSQIKSKAFMKEMLAQLQQSGSILSRPGAVVPGARGRPAFEYSVKA
jgi:predicted ArsR family transcriptional regulator